MIVLVVNLQRLCLAIEVLGGRRDDTAREPSGVARCRAGYRHPAAVSIKLPTFWADNPEDGFMQAEAQFDLSNVTTQRNKFHHVLVVLPKEIINSDTGGIHIHMAAGATDPYDRLKGHLPGGYT